MFAGHFSQHFRRGQTHGVPGGSKGVGEDTRAHVECWGPSVRGQEDDSHLGQGLLSAAQHECHERVSALTVFIISVFVNTAWILGNFGFNAADKINLQSVDGILIKSRAGSLSFGIKCCPQPHVACLNGVNVANGLFSAWFCSRYNRPLNTSKLKKMVGNLIS